MKALFVLAALVLLSVVPVGYVLTRDGGLDPVLAAHYVEHQAEARCLVKTTKFKSAAARQAAYADAQLGGQTGHRLRPADYARALKSSDAELRQRIAARVDALCGPFAS